MLRRWLLSFIAVASVRGTALDGVHREGGVRSSLTLPSEASLVRRADLADAHGIFAEQTDGHAHASNDSEFNATQSGDSNQSMQVEEPSDEKDTHLPVGSLELPSSDAGKKDHYEDAVHYNIRVKGTNKYLKEDDDANARVRCVDVPDKKALEDPLMRFRLIMEEDGRFRIRMMKTHHYLWEYDTDKEVRGTDSIADTYSSFQLEPQHGFNYKIRVVHSKNLLHEDADTGLLKASEMEDDPQERGVFVFEAIDKVDSVFLCPAYFIEAACPPERCSWHGNHCVLGNVHLEGGTSTLTAVAPACLTSCFLLLLLPWARA